jgi:hypothetical protein
MKKKILILSSTLVILASLFFNPKQEQKDLFVYTPEKFVDRKSFMEWIGLVQYRPHQHHTNYRLKSDLKIIGTTMLFYFLDDDSPNYPNNPQYMDFSSTIFMAHHLYGKDKALPKNWQMPESWEKLNDSGTPYIFCISPGAEYTGSATTPICIVRDGYQVYLDNFPVVYEDGHVATLNREQAQKIWKKSIDKYSTDPD